MYVRIVLYIYFYITLDFTLKHIIVGALCLD